MVTLRRWSLLPCLILTILSTGCQAALDGFVNYILVPWPAPASSPADLGLDYEDLRIPTTADRELAAWYVAAPDGTARGTVLFHPGAEGNIGRYLSFLSLSTDNGFNILIYDYQGFGASEGSAAFSSFEDDAHAVMNYLLSRPEPSAHVVIQFGGSIGSLPAISTAAAYPESTVGLVVFGGFFPEQLSGIWTETFLSPLLVPIGNMIGAIWAFLMPDFLDPHASVGRVQAPIISIIPLGDTIVPTQAQLNLFETLPEPKELYWTSAPHSPDALEADPDLSRVLIDWALQLPGLLPAES